MFSLNKIKLCSSAGLSSAYSACLPELPNLVWEIITFAQKNVSLAEESDAVANTHRGKSRGNKKKKGKGKDDKRQKVWDKKQARKGFPMVNHFCNRQNPKEKEVNNLSQKQSC